MKESGIESGDVVQLALPLATVPAGFYVVLTVEADTIVLSRVGTDEQGEFFANRNAGVFQVPPGTVRQINLKATL